MAGYDNNNRGGGGRKRKASTSYDGPQTRGAPHGPPFPPGERDVVPRPNVRDTPPRRPTTSDRRGSGRGGGSAGWPNNNNTNDGRNFRQLDNRGQRTPRTRSPARGQQQQSTPSISRRNTQTPSIPPTPTSALPLTPTPFTPDTAKTMVPAFPSEYWEYVTDARLRDWSNRGEPELMEQAQKALDDNDSTIICEIFGELIKSGIDSRLNPVTCGKVLANIVDLKSGGANDIDLTSLLISSFHPFETAEPPIALIDIIKATGQSEMSLIAGLEGQTLAALELYPSNFKNRVRRIEVGHFFKQQKYNLLREETEGYSKVMAEVFSASNAPNWADCVDQTVDNIKSLIGAFELDPARVLDVLLDMFACNLVANFRFYVKLLQKSPWWPSTSNFDFSENKMDTEDDKRAGDVAFFDQLRDEGVSAFFRPTSQYSSYPDKGNNTAAQLLGFKFRYYQSPGVSDSTPEKNLVWVAALLIRVGFISIADLYPHLGPDDAEVEKEEPAFQKKMREQASKGRMNALAMAGALGEEPPAPGSFAAMREREKATTPKPDAKAKEKEKEKEKEKKPPLNQKITLLVSLLSVGAIPEALFILGKFPFLPGPFPEIADHIHRIVHFSIAPVFNPLRPVITSLAGEERTVYGTTVGGGVGVLKRPPTKITLVPGAFWEPSNLTENVEYRFYWEEWTEGIPICSSADDVIALCDTILKLSGIRLSRDAKLLSKIARIGAADLRACHSDKVLFEERMKKWSRVLRDLLLPSASLVKSNIGVSNDVWNMLIFYPTSQRYSFYGEWTAVWNRQTPEARLRINETEKDTKDLLKRISKTNVKQMARALAKVATGAPGTVFSVALGQIEAYDNLVDVVIDAARYFTNLGYDVLTYTMLISLGNEGKSRMQGDGMATRRWLQTLSVFCGKIFRRYSTLMDPTPVIQYVANQLRRNNSVDLIILKEVITSMAGIVSEANLNDSLIQALAGGDVLRNQVMASFADRRNEAKTTGKRLMKCLTQGGLVDELLILIAQQRQTCVYHVPEEDAHLKLLGNMFDEIHTVLAQYLDLLRFALSPTDYEKQVPAIDKLCLDFGIEPAVAWWVSRAMINQQMRTHDRKMKEAAAKPAESKEDVAMVDASESTPNGDVVLSQTPDDGATSEKEIFHPVLVNIANSIRPSLPEHVWKELSLPFYTTFWQLSIYDIYVPLNSYEQEITKLSQLIKKDMESRDRTKKEKRAQLTNTVDALGDEMKVHIRNNTAARKRLQTEKDHWFVDEDVSSESITKNFLQYCIMPRILLTPNDATFCAKFIRLLHGQATPKFHALGVLDAIFGPGIAATIFMLSQREAENYARFLNELLSELHAWHADKTVYEREAIGKNAAGFSRDGKPLDYEAFRRALYGWHRHLNEAMKTCLSSKEYMQIRNAIIVMKGIAEYFPAVEWIGGNCMARVQALINTEKREDLKIAATAFMGVLKRKEKSWKKTQEFQKSEPSEKNLSLPAEPPEAHAETTVKKAPAPLSLQTLQHIESSTRTPLSAKEIEDGEIPDSATLARIASTLPSAPTQTTVPAGSSAAANLPAKPPMSTSNSKPLPPRPNIPPAPKPMKPVSESDRVSGRERQRDSQRQSPRVHDLPIRKPTPPGSDMPHHLGRDMREPPRGPGQFGPQMTSNGPSGYVTTSPRNRGEWTPDNRRDGRERDSRDLRDGRESRNGRDRDGRESRDTRDAREPREPSKPREPRDDRQDVHPDRMRDHRDRDQRRDQEKPAHRDEQPRSRDGQRLPPLPPQGEEFGRRRSDRIELIPPSSQVPLPSAVVQDRSRALERNDRPMPDSQIPERPQPIPTLELSNTAAFAPSPVPEPMNFRDRRNSPPRRPPPRVSDPNIRQEPMNRMDSRGSNHRSDSGRRSDAAMPSPKPPAGPRADVERDQRDQTRDRERQDRLERPSNRDRNSMGGRHNDPPGGPASMRPPPSGPAHPDRMPMIDPNHGRLTQPSPPSAPRGQWNAGTSQYPPPHPQNHNSRLSNIRPVPTGPSYPSGPMPMSMNSNSMSSPTVIEVRTTQLPLAPENVSNHSRTQSPPRALDRSPSSVTAPVVVEAGPPVHPDRLKQLSGEPTQAGSPALAGGPSQSFPQDNSRRGRDRPTVSTNTHKDPNSRSGPNTPVSASASGREPDGRQLLSRQMRSIAGITQSSGGRRSGPSSVSGNGAEAELTRRASQAELKAPGTPTGPSGTSSGTEKERRSDRDRGREHKEDRRHGRDRDTHESRRGSERGSERGERSEKKERREPRTGEERDRERGHRDREHRDSSNRESRGEARETREGSRKREREDRDSRSDREKRRRGGGAGAISEQWSSSSRS